MENVLFKRLVGSMGITICCFSSVLGQVPPGNPVMYYPFDGNGQDVRGNGPVFTPKETATITTTTGYRESGCLEIGHKGWGEASPNPLFQWTGQFAIGFTIYVPDVRKERVLIESFHEADHKKGWTVTLMSGGRVRLDGHKSVGVTTPETLGPAIKPAVGASVAPGAWHHVLVMRRRRDAEHFDTLIFVNAKLSAVRAKENDRMLKVNRAILIGKGRRRYDKKEWTSDGLKFDNLTVWNRGLSDTEVQAWFKFVNQS